jgi:hypothetical protein
MNLDKKLIAFAAALAAGTFMATPVLATGGGSGGSASSGSSGSASSSSDASAATGSAASGPGGASGAADGSPYPGTGAAATTPTPEVTAHMRDCFDAAANEWRTTPNCARYAGQPRPSAYGGSLAATPGATGSAADRTYDPANAPSATTPPRTGR